MERSKGPVLVECTPAIRNVSSKHIHPLRRAIVCVQADADPCHRRALGDLQFQRVHECRTDALSTVCGQNIQILDLRDLVFTKVNVRRMPDDGAVTRKLRIKFCYYRDPLSPAAPSR